MRRLLLLILVLVCAAGSAAGLVPDFGLIVTSRGTYDSSQASGRIPITPVVRSALWLTLEGSNPTTGDRFWFSGIGTYTYELDDPVFLDLERFQLRSRFPVGTRTVFDINLGRFPFREFSRRVLSHPLDGFQLALRNPAVELTLAMGTSYLLFPESTRILMSKADLSRRLKASLFPGIPRVILQLQTVFPEVILGQSISLAAIGQQDAHPANSVIEVVDQARDESKGGRLNTYYGGLGISGNLLPALYWSGFGYFGGGWALYHDEAFYRFAPILSYLAGGTLRFAVEEPLALRIELGATLAGGDPDHNAYLEGNTAGNSLAFIPISTTTWGMLFSPALTNSAVAEATLAFQPIRNRLGVSLTGYGFARPTTAPISEPGLDPTSAARYLGSEIDAQIDMALFSDVSLVLKGALFLPWGPAFVASASGVDYRVVAELTLGL